MLASLAVLAILLLLNGVMAMSELAMMTSRHSRLHQAALAGNHGASMALSLAKEPTRFLSTVQVGITLVGILSGALGEKQLSSHIQAWLDHALPVLAGHSDTIALAFVVVGITYFWLVLGELVPKRLALAFPESIASAIARPLSTLSVVGSLPVRLLTASTEGVLKLFRVRSGTGDDVSEDDVRALVARAATTGVFTRQEHVLLQRVFRVSDLTVYDLMVPRPEIVWIKEETTVEALHVLVGTSPYSHFPVCRGSLDQVLGVVHIKDLIAFGLLAGRDFKPMDVAQPPICVPESMPALRLLDQFQSTRLHVAFVVDEYGGTQGLVTLNDVVTALVGDVSRRGEQPPPKAVRRDDGSWLMDGLLPLHEMVATLDLPPEAEADLPNVSTLGGLVMARLGHLPTEGEHCEWQGFRFEVVDMDGTRIDQVLVQQLPPALENRD